MLFDPRSERRLQRRQRKLAQAIALADQLGAVLDRITSGWCQGSFNRPVYELIPADAPAGDRLFLRFFLRRDYCIAGAIRDVVERSNDRQRLYRYIARLLPASEELDNTAISQIIGYNDEDGRAHNEVIDFLRYAKARAAANAQLLLERGA